MGIEYEPSTDSTATTLLDCFGSNHGYIIKPYKPWTKFFKLSYTPDGAQTNAWVDMSTTLATEYGYLKYFME